MLPIRFCARLIIRNRYNNKKRNTWNNHLKTQKMKKTLLTLSLFLLFTTISFAGGNKHNNTNLFKELSTALSAANQKTYNTTGEFSGSSFKYNGKTIRAFYNNNDGDLVGFSIPLTVEELPAGSVENIQNKYKGWQIKEAMMFIGDDNNINYYIATAKDKKPTLVLKLGAKNKPFIYSKM